MPPLTRLRFAAAGLGDVEPFAVERSGRRPDGSRTHLAFTLAFAADERLPRAGFFTCRHHHRPEDFWSPLLQRHPNGATDITAVVLGVAQPEAHVEFLGAFTGAPASQTGSELLIGCTSRLHVQQTSGVPGFSGFTRACTRPTSLGRRLHASNVPVEWTPRGLSVPADGAFGVRISVDAVAGHSGPGAGTS